MNKVDQTNIEYDMPDAELEYLLMQSRIWELETEVLNLRARLQIIRPNLLMFIQNNWTQIIFVLFLIWGATSIFR